MPVGPDDWVLRDDAFAPQMAERDRLLRAERRHILADVPEPLIADLLSELLDVLARSPGYAVWPDRVERPDGVTVPLEPSLETLTRLVQEDLLFHLKSGDAHVLLGGILAFPASWSLAEKVGRPLLDVHEPVEDYTDDIGRRVERLFDGLRPGRPLMRANWLLYDTPDLYSPRRERARRDRSLPPRYLRSERQCLLKLKVTGAVVFSIHTSVYPLSDIPEDEQAFL